MKRVVADEKHGAPTNFSSSLPLPIWKPKKGFCEPIFFF